MNPSNIINELQSRLHLPHAFQVSCKVDNFTGDKQIQTRYEIYIDEQKDCTSVHAQGKNLEEAFSKACEHIERNFIPQLNPNHCTPVPDPFPDFTSCLSYEQDETLDEIEPLES